MKKSLFCFAVLLLSACNSQLLTDLPTFPPIDDLVVTATLRTDERQVKVLVSKPVTASSVPIEYVRGLSVTLSTGNATFTLRDTVITSLVAAPQPCYLLSNFQPRSGERYEVRARYKEQIIVGTTVIPERAKIVSTIKQLVWTKTSAKFYRIFVSSLGTALPNSFGFFTVTSDSTVAIPSVGDNNGAAFIDGAYAVRIEGIDENLSRFMRNESLREGLSGGFGVVGSISVQTDTLILKRE